MTFITGQHNKSKSFNEKRNQMDIIKTIRVQTKATEIIILLEKLFCFLKLLCPSKQIVFILFPPLLIGFLASLSFLVQRFFFCKRNNSNFFLKLFLDEVELKLKLNQNLTNHICRKSLSFAIMYILNFFYFSYSRTETLLVAQTVTHSLTHYLDQS